MSESSGLAGYDSSLACTRNTVVFDPGASNSVTVNSGDVVVCTFTNELIVPLVPQLSVTKSANPTTLPAGGGSVTYTYTVSNGGDVVLALVWADDKCAPVTYVSGDTNPDTLLQPGETWTLTCTTTITATTTNTIVVTGTGSDTQKVTAQAQATVTVLPAVATPTPTPKASIQGATSKPHITLPPTDTSTPGGSTGGGDGLPITLMLLVGIAALAPLVVKANWKSKRP